MIDIKFRVFHNNEMKMLPFSILQSYNNMLKLVFGESWHDDFCTDYTKEPILMQNTGLKDSKGVDIYEGDIVEWLGHILPISVQHKHGMQFCIGSYNLNREMAERSKVIGHIYENPELIEEVTE